jgi:hypothetical protein
MIPRAETHWPPPSLSDVGNLIQLFFIPTSVGRLVLIRRGSQWRLKRANQQTFVNVSAAVAESALRLTASSDTPAEAASLSNAAAAASTPVTIAALPRRARRACQTRPQAGR